MGLVKTFKLKIYRFLSMNVWGSLPASFQKYLSSIYSNIYNKPFSRVFIKPYCWLNYDNPEYIKKFRPASGNNYYINFQDFFIRVFKNPLKITSQKIWGCEGLFCDYGKISDKPVVKIKNQLKNIGFIFGKKEGLPEDYYFSNIFLHNNNYHRIHAPTSGRITRVQHVPGDLVLLRPWIYENAPSLPAFRNERVNVDIKDKNGKTWFLSIVGGPAVGTIVMSELVHIDQWVEVGQEIATFLLGSTCCIASPYPVDGAKIGDTVTVDDPY